MALWLLLWLCSLPCQAMDHIVERSWLEDETGTLQWPEVRQRPTQAFEGVLSRGFGRSVIWVRLRIDPGVKAPSPRESDQLILRIRPVYLDDIQVFDPLAEGGRAGVTGDLRHPREQELPGLDFLLPIARGETPRDIWLRLSSTSTRQVVVQALSMDDLNKLTLQQELVFTLCVGLVLIFMVWGLVYWLFSREPIIGVFTLKQATALVYALCSLGYLRTFWPPAWPAQWLDWTTSLFSMCAVTAAILFHVVLIDEFDPPAWAVHVHRFLLALFPAMLVLFFLADQPTLALRINMAEVLLVPFIFLISISMAQGWSRPEPSQSPPLARPVVIGFYALLVLILAAAGLPGLALANGGEVGLYVVQAHGLVTGFLVLLMLQYRAHKIQKRQNETILALEKTRLQALQDRDVREEQGKLLTMLTHELKTPLAIMHMRLDAQAQGSQEIRQAIRDMNGVIERCVQATQLGDSQLMPRIETLDLVSLTREAVASCAQPDRIQADLPTQILMASDRQLLLIVLNNLLENACKYADADTPITVQLLVPTPTAGVQPCVELHIANAPGAAGWPDEHEVFNKYYRTPHARRQPGTGLGLFLVRHLMQTLGGSIDYAPTADRIRFVLKLPLMSQTQ